MKPISRYIEEAISSGKKTTGFRKLHIREVGMEQMYEFLDTIGIEIPESEVSGIIDSFEDLKWNRILGKILEIHKMYGRPKILFCSDRSDGHIYVFYIDRPVVYMYDLVYTPNSGIFVEISKYNVRTGADFEFSHNMTQSDLVSDFEDVFEV